MRELGLDPKMIEALSAIETRPRMQLLEDGVLINLRGVNTNPGADPEDMVAIRIWFNSEIIISAIRIWFNSEIIISARKHERRLLSIEDVRQSIEQGKGPKTPAEFVSAVVEKLANRISDVVDTIDEELTGVETALDERKDNVRQIQQRLSDLRTNRRDPALSSAAARGAGRALSLGSAPVRR
jgi:zinc transporter